MAEKPEDKLLAAIFGDKLNPRSPAQVPSLPLTASEIKLGRKRWNEQTKAVSSAFSNVGLAVAVAAVLEPAVQNKPNDINFLWAFFAIVWFVGAVTVLGFMQAED